MQVRRWAAILYLVLREFRPDLFQDYVDPSEGLEGSGERKRALDRLARELDTEARTVRKALGRLRDAVAEERERATVSLKRRGRK
jgi:hypothetical protein